MAEIDNVNISKRRGSGKARSRVLSWEEGERLITAIIIGKVISIRILLPGVDHAHRLGARRESVQEQWPHKVKKQRSLCEHKLHIRSLIVIISNTHTFCFHLFALFHRARLKEFLMPREGLAQHMWGVLTGRRAFRLLVVSAQSRAISGVTAVFNYKLRPVLRAFAPKVSVAMLCYDYVHIVFGAVDMAHHGNNSRNIPILCS